MSHRGAAVALQVQAVHGQSTGSREPWTCFQSQPRSDLCAQHQLASSYIPEHVGAAHGTFNLPTDASSTSPVKLFCINPHSTGTKSVNHVFNSIERLSSYGCHDRCSSCAAMHELFQKAGISLAPKAAGRFSTPAESTPRRSSHAYGATYQRGTVCVLALFTSSWFALGRHDDAIGARDSSISNPLQDRDCSNSAK